MTHEAGAIDHELEPEETAYADLEAEDEEKIETLLSSSLPPVRDVSSSYDHDGSLMENSTYLSALSHLPPRSQNAYSKPADTCVDLMPLSQSRAACPAFAIAMHLESHGKKQSPG